MAKKRRQRKAKLQPKPTLSHINERRHSVMKLPIVEHIAASDRKIAMFANVMRMLKLEFREIDNGKGFKIVAAS